MHVIGLALAMVVALGLGSCGGEDVPGREVLTTASGDGIEVAVVAECFSQTVEDCGLLVYRRQSPATEGQTAEELVARVKPMFTEGEVQYLGDSLFVVELSEPTQPANRPYLVLPLAGEHGVLEIRAQIEQTDWDRIHTYSGQEYAASVFQAEYDPTTVAVTFHQQDVTRGTRTLYMAGVTDYDIAIKSGTAELALQLVGRAQRCVRLRVGLWEEFEGPLEFTQLPCEVGVLTER